MAGDKKAPSRAQPKIHQNSFQADSQTFAGNGTIRLGLYM